MPTPKWPSFSPLGATLLSMCEWGGSRYRRGGDGGVKVGIVWIWCSADVILSRRCLRFDLCLWTYSEICNQTWRCSIFEFVSRNCAANLLQNGDKVCCGRESLHPCSCRILLTPSGEITGHFGFLHCSCWPHSCVLKATASTQLHCLSSLHTLQTKAWAYTCKCASLKLPVVILWASTIR